MGSRNVWWASLVLLCSCADDGPRSVGKDTTAPTLRSSVPTNGQMGVLVNTAITLEFSEAMTTSSVTVSVLPPTVLSAPEWSSGDTVVTFVPSSPLAGDTSYQLSVVGKDVAGNALVASPLFFKTGAGADACLTVTCDSTKGTCVNGSCRCGDTSACTGNQSCVFDGASYRCANPARVCSPTCNNDVCCNESFQCVSQPAEAFNKCGAACADCAAFNGRANTCVDGACGCGTGGVCNPDQRCNSASNQCVCDSTSCPNGCCTSYVGGQCIPFNQQSVGQCQTGGALCFDYSGKADACTNGVARCGGGIPCTGQATCSGGVCTVPTCTAQTCANGCCNGPTINECVTADPRPLTTCGPNGGSSCQNLTNKADACTSAGGTCGGGPSCEDELECLNGACACRFNGCTSNISGQVRTDCCNSALETQCKFGGIAFNCVAVSECSNSPSCGLTPTPGCCQNATP